MDLAFTQIILILVIRVMESKANDQRTSENDTNVDGCRSCETVHTADSHTTTESACGVSGGSQLAIYRPVLPVLEQSEREFEIAGHKWTITQQWSDIGLSAVIWEAVSRDYLKQL